MIIHIGYFNVMLHTKDSDFFKKCFPSIILPQAAQFRFCQIKEINSIDNILIPPLQGIV
uniref:Uncharacterized protein n=1 Tax=Arundo donax TaxID=35708 RepID=A0A0A8ZGF8_ARUDO